MEAETRRARIKKALLDSRTPISASRLAGELGVSRQIIVGDIALLRAAGTEIIATPRGYTLPAGSAAQGKTFRIACRHRSEQMEEELFTIVDHGCQVLDVIVEHPIYGELTGSLHLASRYDAEEFLRRCRNESAAPLSLLTEGIHLHTILCPDEDAFQRVTDALREKGILLPGE